jgi:hypothetical protein
VPACNLVARAHGSHAPLSRPRARPRALARGGANRLPGQAAGFARHAGGVGRNALHCPGHADARRSAADGPRILRRRYAERKAPMWPASAAVAADQLEAGRSVGQPRESRSGAERSLRGTCCPTAEPACVWRRWRPWRQEGGRGALALPRLRVAGGLPRALRRHLGHRRARARGWRVPRYVNAGSGFGRLALWRLLSAPEQASGGCPKLRPASANQQLRSRWPIISYRGRVFGVGTSWV